MLINNARLSFFEKILINFNIYKKPSLIKGFYIYGDVGRGKSMIMDLFFKSTIIKNKRRVHFYSFMQEIHNKIHEVRSKIILCKYKTKDPFKIVIKNISNNLSLLCFDEFQVTNIADAMILSRLFNKLFDIGVIIVITSNQKPEDLYLNGINRQLFIPFINLLKNKCEIINLKSKQDYRIKNSIKCDIYIYPNDTIAKIKLNSIWVKLTNGAFSSAKKLFIQGRKVIVPLQCNKIARFDFNDLCSINLGSVDYLIITKYYHTILIDNIPQFNDIYFNELKRFIILIDTLYEKNINLICSAEVDINKLYVEEYNIFEFKRTISRLTEMCSEKYFNKKYFNFDK